MPNIQVLNIFLHDTEIGSLARLPGDRHLFTFNQDYIDQQNRPTLSLSFKDIYGELITDIKPTQTRLPPFFSNLLPEGIFRDYLAKQAGVKSEQEFYLLWILGGDLPGAIKALPEKEQDLPSDIEHALKAANNSSELDNIFRFSLAGVQLKFSATQEKDRGLTIPVGGVGGAWIVKLPDVRYAHVPENEYAMMELARNIGINVPETMLVSLDKIKGLPKELHQQSGMAFAIKRFDRNNNLSANHIEDFAQVFNAYAAKKYGHASYRNIADIIWGEVGETGIIEFIRRLVFNVLIGNGDMHLKNWSLIYSDKITPELAPAYDFVSTISYIKNDTLALSLAGKKIFSTLTIDTFSKFAAKASLPEKLVRQTVRETIDLFSDNWNNIHQSSLNPNIKKAIDEHLKILSLWQG